MRFGGRFILGTRNRDDEVVLAAWHCDQRRALVLLDAPVSRVRQDRTVATAATGGRVGPDQALLLVSRHVVLWVCVTTDAAAASSAAVYPAVVVPEGNVAKKCRAWSKKKN